MTDDRPLFSTPEQIVRCWAKGIPSGCKAIPLEPEGGSGSAFARNERMFKRSEQYAVACAVMRRAFKAGLSSEQAIVLVWLLVRDESWQRAAEAAGLDDPKISADAVSHRVYRAKAAGLRTIWSCT